MRSSENCFVLVFFALYGTVFNLSRQPFCKALFPDMILPMPDFFPRTIRGLFSYCYATTWHGRNGLSNVGRRCLGVVVGEDIFLLCVQTETNFLCDVREKNTAGTKQQNQARGCGK
jgi:hypothetical protein